MVVANALALVAGLGPDPVEVSANGLGLDIAGLGPGLAEVAKVVSDALAVVVVAGLEVAEVVAIVLSLVTGVVAGLGLGLVEFSADCLGLLPGLKVVVDDLARASSLVAQVLEVRVVRFWVVLWCRTICTCGLHYCAVVVGLHQSGFG